MTVRASCLICTVPRSGSWLLADLVNQTDLVGQPEEYFRPDHRRTWSVDWGIPREGPYDRYIESALANTSTDNGVFGVKLHWYQLRWFLDQLRELPAGDSTLSDAELVARWLPDPRYVHLHRDDRVRQAISYYRAAHSDLWFELDAEDPLAERQTPLSPVPMPAEPDWGQVRYLENVVVDGDRRWVSFFEQSGIEALDVRYEDLIAGYQDTVERILDFLGLTARPGVAPPTPRLKKQADDQTERWVEAYLRHRESVTPKELHLRENGRVVTRQSAEAAER